MFEIWLRPYWAALNKTASFVGTVMKKKEYGEKLAIRKPVIRSLSQGVSLEGGSEFRSFEISATT
jgi:hypothetical protein